MTNKSLWIVPVLALLAADALPAQKNKKNKTYADPAVAKKEDPAFSLQGEYATIGRGLQVIALGGDKFKMVSYSGGLPGLGG